jgi:hypothetical protein
MQVSDSAAAPPIGTGTKDEARAAADDRANDGRRRTGGSFRGALDGRRAAAAGGDVASAAALAAWFRPESMAASYGAPPPRPAAAVAAAGAIDRILIGAGPDGAQARIRIASGALAGTELQLFSGAAGHTVEARLLTHAASSRETLSVVMDEIRARLRDKGIVLSATLPAAPARRRARDVGSLDTGLPRGTAANRVGTDR